MRLFDYLFGRKPASEEHAQGTPGREYPAMSTEFIEIPSRRFYGQCARSPNTLYVLAWRDGNDSGTSGGSRRSGQGRYYLLRHGQVITEGLMPRPNDGRVVDNGTFILNDWGFGDGLKGTFCAFDCSGQKLIVRSFRANLFNNGISSDGRVAVCQTCNAPGSDGGTLAIFDLTRRVQISTWSPESGWADFYEFPRDGLIRLGYRKLGAFVYTWDGEFVGREAWYDAQLAKGDYSGTLVMVERLLKEANGKLSLDFAMRLIRGIDRVIPTLTIAEGRLRLGPMKLRGLCLEAAGNIREALDCYERAVSLDPKVGVKRRIEQIRRGMATEQQNSKA